MTVDNGRDGSKASGGRGREGGGVMERKEEEKNTECKRKAGARKRGERGYEWVGGTWEGKK